MSPNDTKPPNSPAAKAASRDPLPAAELFMGRKAIDIEFNNEIYRLRITRNQKLILTK